MKTKLLAAFLLIFCSALSQIKQDQRIWFSYLGQYKVSEKWGYHIEAQFRLDNQLEQNLQNGFRFGAIYYLSPKANITAGYALVKTFSPSLEKFSTENRFWEQYQYNKKWHDNKNTMTHRFRLEQRFVEHLATVSGESNEFNYQNRLRYLNRNVFHVANLSSDKEEIYAVAQNEVFLSLGNNKVNSKFIDQNRFMVGLGLNYNNNIRLELGYLNQFATSSYGDNTMNHIVSISLLQNLDLEKH
ncbi:MAG TPA: DUF2490 domain-containing protein [Flavobacterium sp.]|uniref:DUF2490 domain-containing protein n=1 Tax=Flavobacterium sp. TaxID=239 RepID=UPI002C2AF75F|nr:DUF2490 domain-containing protein [Flavobacterium sp.]HNP32646.1 DUF2490 domain-containing protein [Flavobacterium sp.]